MAGEAVCTPALPADDDADCHTLRLPSHHGGQAPQAGGGDAAHQPSRPCLPRAGVAGLRRDRDGQTHRPKVGRQQGYGAEGSAG